jgi:acetyl-CoA synthetase
MMTPTAAFVRARDFLLDHRDDYDKAYREFVWPDLPIFNWALDWFDVLAQGNERPALWIIRDQGHDVKVTFAELSERSSRVANYLRTIGVVRGDRVLMMLPNVLPIWEVMLAAIKLGATIIPASAQLTPEDIRDRILRGGVRYAITDSAGADKFAQASGDFTRIVVGSPAPGFLCYDDALSASPRFVPDGDTRAEDPLLLYFTSGTTAKPKLVLHTHQSYPVGHLSTMYWIGIREGDVHQNISSPGWAKHAWSSFFAPWNAGATVVMHDYARFSAARSLDVLRGAGVNTLCAPPTVWRMMIVDALCERPASLRELVSAGEPLNPEVIEQVRTSWGITIRDGYGQTETTAQIGNSPGQEVRLGSMGRPLPGYQVALLDGAGREASEGEIALHLSPRPRGLMVGYLDDAARTAAATSGGYYRTGDEALRDGDGYLHYVGRGDDVFKSSDYRISPFELESVLIEHPSVAEVAVVPCPDALRTTVPKAYVALVPGVQPSAALGREILAFAREKLAPYKRVRRLEFAELPKTISGKIRRVELRARERERSVSGERGEHEHRVEDFENKQEHE